MYDLSEKASSPTNTYGILMYPKGKGVGAGMFKRNVRFFYAGQSYSESFIRPLLPISA